MVINLVSVFNTSESGQVRLGQLSIKTGEAEVKGMGRRQMRIREERETEAGKERAGLSRRKQQKKPGEIQGKEAMKHKRMGQFGKRQNRKRKGKSQTHRACLSWKLCVKFALMVLCYQFITCYNSPLIKIIPIFFLVACGEKGLIKVFLFHHITMDVQTRQMYQYLMFKMTDFSIQDCNICPCS